jgi:hypothetical protein
VKPIYKFFLILVVALIGFLSFLNHSFFDYKVGFFTFLAILLPFSLRFLGIANSLIAVVALRISLFLYGGFLFLIPSTFGIPTLIYAFCWHLERERSEKASLLKILINIVLPICCVTLFFCWPGIGLGALYSFYWLIVPAVFAFQVLSDRSHRFDFLLTTTRIVFIQHAIGSIIWLFLFPSTSEKWLALIPVVALEKITLVATIVIFGFAINCCQSMIKNRQNLFSLTVKKNVFKKRKSLCSI